MVGLAYFSDEQTEVVGAFPIAFVEYQFAVFVSDSPKSDCSYSIVQCGSASGDQLTQSLSHAAAAGTIVLASMTRTSIVPSAIAAAALHVLQFVDQDIAANPSEPWP